MNAHQPLVAAARRATAACLAADVGLALLIPGPLLLEVGPAIEPQCGLALFGQSAWLDDIGLNRRERVAPSKTNPDFVLQIANSRHATPFLRPLTEPQHDTAKSESTTASVPFPTAQSSSAGNPRVKILIVGCGGFGVARTGRVPPCSLMVPGAPLKPSPSA